MTETDYFTEIEAHFAARRGTPFILSAKDWALMQKWRAEGVPLPVVIEAIDSVFDKAAERKKTVNSLHYCRHAIKDLWDERRELQVGAEESVPEADVSAALAELADAVAASTTPVAAAFADHVRALASEKSVPRIEERLIELEHELVESTLAALPADERDAVRAEVARIVGGGAMDEKTRARTEEANLRRVVRDRFGLPRLTLFR